MDKHFTAVLVGCGNISETWLTAIKKIPTLNIVGLVDTIEEKALATSNKYGLNASIDNILSTSLQRNKPDLVFVCTTPESRLEIISTAFRYDCHVLVEKPLANTIAEARKIISMAEKEQKLCATIQNHRYDNGIRRLSRFIASGVLGDITFCNTQFFIGSTFDDFRRHMHHVLLKDMAIHTFDAARAVLKADPVSVYCKEWNPKASQYDHDAAAVAIFEFSNGVVYSYQGSWSSQGLRTPWTSQWRINGTRGSVVWNGGEDFSAQVVNYDNTGGKSFSDLSVPKLDCSDKVGGHAGIIEEFVECVRSQRQPETICNENIKSLEMVYAAIESSTRGVKVDIIN